MKKHRARKRFGQNFLSDQGVIQRILASIAPREDDCLLEIGPGQGALTLPMLSLVKQLTAVEIDRDLIPYLQQKSMALGHLNLIEADALVFDFSSLKQDKPLRIYGNLPYNISSPLLFHLLDLVEHIEDMHFMLQKEVVERLAAEPGCKSYGRLSVIIQYYCEVEYLFTVPPSAFEPQPKVDSAIVRLTPYKSSPYPRVPLKSLQNVLRLAFAQRRKTLKNNLKAVISAEQLAALGIDASQRPEQLSVADYVKIGLYVA